MWRANSEMTLNSNLSRSRYGTYGRRFHVIVIALVFFLFPAIIPFLAVAQDQNDTATSEDKVHIESDGQTVIDIKQASIEYNVNVKIILGQTHISADSVKFFLKKDSGTTTSVPADAVGKIIATGNVRIVFENDVATGREAVYDAADETLFLLGEPATVVSNGIDMESPEFVILGFTFNQ